MFFYTFRQKNIARPRAADSAHLTSKKRHLVKSEAWAAAYQFSFADCHFQKL
ncbi:hypothetical protein L248_1886 [Schleiferilactobacillus shenzhenensis LY-73]|uniref:Uncharacterized protein n=1 Tax=Schleiferilactobacillus shenzhenensis LY-73 TaxID=1231336 RepID=U4TQV1_9LACO|nr:hypothetical protein L248_1886 [Schleiferilactobacillus shenzhenensis LY-73]